MQTYNQIMKYFWLSAGILIFLVVTFLGFRDGFDKWSIYYIFVITSVGMYFFKSWMMKRFDKHNEYLDSMKKSHRDSNGIL